MPDKDPYAATAIQAPPTDDPYAATAVADSAPTIPVVASKAPSLADRYNAAVAPLTEIQKPDSAHPWDYHEAIKAVGNIGAGGMGLALHPIDTLAGLGGMLTAPLELAQGHPWSSTVPAQFLKSLQTNPYGAIESGIGQAAVGDLVTRTPELVRSGAESVARAATDTGAGPVKRLVKDTQKANETIDAVNQDRIEKQRTDQIKADADHRGDLLKLRQKYEQSVRDATEKARTGTAADRAKVQSKNLAAKQKYEQDVRDAQQAYQTQRTEALRANAEAQRAHNQKIGQTAQQNRAATAAERAKVDQEGKLQVGGSQLIYGLRQLDKALRDRAGTMFDAVREKVGAVTRPGTDLGTAARAALSKISGSSTVPKPFSDILGKYPETEPEFIEYQGAQIPKTNRLYDVLKQQGMGTGAHPVTFGDLQGYYSETGAELSKGNLPGDVYQATKELHNAIGDMMQEMATKAGAGKQFWDSRVFYRNYMDAFHEPAGPSSSGSPIAQALLAKDPAVAVDKFAGDAGDRGIANLRRYSNSLADLAQNVRKTAQEKVTVPARKSATDIPIPKAKPVPAGVNLPLPGVVEPPPTARAANLPLPPVLPEPETVPVELKPRQTISSPDLAAARRAAYDSRLNKIESRGYWAATWPLFQAARALWGGHIPSIPTMGLESAGMLATVKATTHLMRYPPLRQFLEQARPQDLASIPPDLRGDLPGLVSLAQRQGIKVAPALVAATAGAAGQPSQQVQQPALQGAQQ